MEIRLLTDPSEVLPIFLARYSIFSGAEWDALLLAHDFGMLNPSEILAWVRPAWANMPTVQCLADHGIKGSALFELALWDACREATGAVPRPGHQRWEKAQDRWRVALLQEALSRTQNPETLASLVVDIYETLGFPEDMLGLWRQKDRAVTDPPTLEAFVQCLEDRLREGTEILLNAS